MTKINILLSTSACKELECTSVIVTSMKKGSILVTFSLILKNNATASIQEVF